MVLSHIPFLFLLILCFLYPPNYLVAHVVFDVRSQVTKLNPKSLKCVFLCYSCTQKGYRCFFPDLGGYLISVDVSFFEDRPFFVESRSSLSVCESDDSFLTYTITHYIPPTPIAICFKFFEHTFSSSPGFKRGYPKRYSTSTLSSAVRFRK